MYTNGSSTVFSASYTLEPLGNRKAISENVNGVSRSLNYNYDELSRLISETQQIGSAQSTTSTYQYDLLSNRTQLTSYLPSNIKGGSTPLVLSTTYGYDIASRMITRSVLPGTPSVGNNYTYGYDDSGNLVSESNNAPGGEVTTYIWDTRQRLVGWQKQAKGAILAKGLFTYDGKDSRVSMSYGGKTTSYLQDNEAELPVVLQEAVSGQAQPSSFVYAPGSTTPLYQNDASGTGLWYHSDGLGSVRALTNNSGGVVNTNSYSAFGLNAGESGKAANNHLFAGEQLDPTGLYFNRARYYNPAIGRFVGRDSEAGDNNEPVTLNRYTYANNNPVLLSDPTGFSALNAAGVNRPGVPRPQPPSPGNNAPSFLHFNPCLTIGDGGIPPIAKQQPRNDTKPSNIGLVIGIFIAIIIFFLTLIGAIKVKGKKNEPKSDNDDDDEEFRGSLQIQGQDILKPGPKKVSEGNKLDKDTLSWKWERAKPLTSREARQRLAKLWTDLTTDQRRRRTEAHNDAVKFLLDAEKAGGVPPKKGGYNFQNKEGQRDGVEDARIDIVVNKGINLVP